MRGFVIVLVAGCGRIGFSESVDGSLPIPDATTVDAKATQLFSAPVLVAELFDVTRQMANPALSSDQLEMFVVVRATPQDGGQVQVTKRSTTAAAWGAPAPVAPLNAAADQSGLHLSRDDLTMWFDSNRAPTLGGHDIYIASRPTRSVPFSAPMVVPTLSSARDETSPGVDASQTILVLNVGPVPRELRASTRANAMATWPAPTTIQELSSPSDDVAAELSPDALTIYFSSDRAPGIGGLDLFVATRASIAEPFGAPRPIVELNSPQEDSSPWISPDGHVIYFVSGRDGANAIYRANR